MVQTSRKVWMVASITILIVLAGCMSISTTVTVNNDGALEKMEVVIEMDETLYEMIETDALEEGYDSVEEYLLSEEEDDPAIDPSWERINYEEEFIEDDNTYILTFLAEEGDPEQLDDIDVTVEDDQITYIEHDTFADEVEGDEFDEFMDQINLEYTVHMPGEIIETNGQILEDEESVQWTIDEHDELDTFEVMSERGEEDDDTIPGFGIPLAIVAIGSVIYLFIKT